MFLIIIERLWKVFNAKCVYFVQEPWKRLLLNIYFYVKDCVAASRNISMFFKERAAASERYQWTTASERKCAADIFLCVAASRNISMFFNERAAASEKILTTASEIY